jgi:ATP-binding cassette subfamily F protein 3
MSNLLQLQAGTKSFGPKILFDKAQFAVNEGEHVGVIGPNGAGKTTLFKILTGQESLDSGTIVKSNGLRIGYLAQHDVWTKTETVEEYVQKNSLMPLWELRALGKKLGISDSQFSSPISGLSGGYRMRCKLLNLIGQQPNLMLLDEPTNYLDLETTLVLEQFLQGFSGAFLLISHDREFLQKTTDHILEVEQGEITKYNGNLEDYFEQKEMLRRQLEARAMSLQEKKKEIMDFVTRFGAKATKAKQAQSRLKSLQKMETVDVKAIPITATIKIPEPVRTGKIILSINDANLGYGNAVILKNVNYILNRGDHVAVIGLNGAGKSTFLKSLAGALPLISGKVEAGMSVVIGYYAQHVAENLEPSQTVLHQMMAKSHPEVTQQDALNMAGSLLFSGDEVHKTVSVLSGGEKSRVALGQILLQKAPCLILDEPTNHLDFQTVEALTQSLAGYSGTVVVVSHDRSFIKRVGKKIVEINHGQALLYPGTYDDYVWSLQKGVLAERTQQVDGKSGGTQNGRDAIAAGVKNSSENQPNNREIRKTIEKELRQKEKFILESDRTLAQLTQSLNDLNLKISTGGGDQRLKMIEELVQTQAQIDELELKWLTAVEEKEELQKKLNPSS